MIKNRLPVLYTRFCVCVEASRVNYIAQSTRREKERDLCTHIQKRPIGEKKPLAKINIGCESQRPLLNEKWLLLYLIQLKVSSREIPLSFYTALGPFSPKDKS